MKSCGNTVPHGSALSIAFCFQRAAQPAAACGRATAAMQPSGADRQTMSRKLPATADRLAATTHQKRDGGRRPVAVRRRMDGAREASAHRGTLEAQHKKRVSRRPSPETASTARRPTARKESRPNRPPARRAPTNAAKRTEPITCAANCSRMHCARGRVGPLPRADYFRGWVCAYLSGASPAAREPGDAER